MVADAEMLRQLHRQAADSKESEAAEQSADELRAAREAVIRKLMQFERRWKTREEIVDKNFEPPSIMDLVQKKSESAGIIIS